MPAVGLGLGGDGDVETQGRRLGREAHPWSCSQSLKLSTGYNESRNYSFQTGGGSEEFRALLVGFHQNLSKSLRESNVCLHCLQSSQGILARLRYHRVEVFQKILPQSSPFLSVKSIGHSWGPIDCGAQLDHGTKHICSPEQSVCVCPDMG